MFDIHKGRFLAKTNLHYLTDFFVVDTVAVPDMASLFLFPILAAFENILVE
jgi:hypothetical protein